MTEPRHSLFGQTFEVQALVSRRGPKWVSIRLPDGRQRPVRRASTDLEMPLPDSKSAPLISASVLLRVARFIEALSRGSEEHRHEAPDIGTPAIVLSTSAVASVTGGHATPHGGGDGSDAEADDRSDSEAGQSPC
ncbi:hypothetical protein [Sphingobium yanoikuyae]|uniref:hypothetical protein n=1 Tax=Sphingobium yanoikuyae TaxID=13690 RepID=UPI0015F4B5A4|nr:hypothetical protein [Sphingobium yanoikuyae]MDV3480090.1 hypothetical protein [Sphingobium yanoikuyae]